MFSGSWARSGGSVVYCCQDKEVPRSHLDFSNKRILGLILLCPHVFCSVSNMVTFTACFLSLCVFSGVISGTAGSSSLPNFPSRTDRPGVAAWWSLGAAVSLLLLNRSRPLLPPQGEPTTQQLQGAARHLKGHHCYPPQHSKPLTSEGLRLPDPRSLPLLIHACMKVRDSAHTSSGQNLALTWMVGTNVWTSQRIPLIYVFD